MGSDGGLRVIWMHLGTVPRSRRGPGHGEDGHSLDGKRTVGGPYLGLGPTTVRLCFGFVDVFFVGLDFDREDLFLEFLPLGVCLGRISVVLMW